MVSMDYFGDLRLDNDMLYNGLHGDISEDDGVHGVGVLDRHCSPYFACVVDYTDPPIEAPMNAAPKLTLRSEKHYAFLIRYDFLGRGQPSQSLVRHSDALYASCC